MHALDAIHLANGLSGIAYVALGVFVLSVRSRDPTNLAFGAYALAWSLVVFLSNFGLEVGHASLFAFLGRTVFSLVVFVALTALLTRYPTPLGRREWPLVGIALLVALPAGLGYDALASPVAVPLTGAPALIVAAGKKLFDVGFWALLVLLALRWRGFDEAGRRVAALISAAIVIWPSIAMGEISVLAPDLRILLFDLLPLLAIVALWLWNSVKGGAVARAVAWLALSAMLAAMLERTLFPAAPDLWGYGVARLAGVALLAYAIVRHQLLGIDVKVRWTLSKSTVAAAFVAAFFLASEGAQLLFGRENQLVGLVAAGALVFALAPLQRVADRIAERAVPVAGPQARDLPAPRPQHEEAYKAAVRLAMRGDITRKEELELARIADAHGLSVVRAHELRDEAEQEAASG